MCSPLGSVLLAPPRAQLVSSRSLNAAAGLLAGDAASLPIQWIYSREVLQEAAEASGGALRFLDMEVARRLYDDARVPAGRKMCVSDRKQLGDISVNSELFLVAAESLAACNGELSHLDFDKRFFEQFGPGGPYVGYVDSAMRRKLRLIDAQAERECPTRDGDKFMQVIPVGRGATTATTDRVCPFSESAEVASKAVNPPIPVAEPGSGCPYAAAAAAPSPVPDTRATTDAKAGGVCPYMAGTLAPRTEESWTPTGVDDAQSPALGPALAVACLHAVLVDEDLLPRVNAAVRATHANGQASMYCRAAARLLAGVIRGEDLGTALLAAAAVPRCPVTAKRLLDVLEHSSTDSVAVAAEFGTECHLEMVVPSAFHAILHADSFEDGLERVLAAGGDVVGRAMLVGSVLGALYGQARVAECLGRVAPEHVARLGLVLAPAEGQQISTRCPVAKDDAPEFMHDAPRLVAGDLFPDVEVDAACLDAGGAASTRRFAPRAAGGPCIVCVLGTECCISIRFALPELERRVWQPFAAGKTALPCFAIGRGSSAAALEEFRTDCAQKQAAGDRHIRQPSMPMVPDEDGSIFRQLADSIVPRFYLLDDHGRICDSTAGYDPADAEDTSVVARMIQSADKLSGSKP